MPVDPSRRAPRKSANNEQDTDVRRARGEISCAECRRLKLRCDKKLPCGSCIRRGCPSICPNGISTQTSRVVLASTDHLNSKIGEMGQRIRQLEDALAIFQASTGSNEQHPLLQDELLAIKFGPEKAAVPPKPNINEPSVDSIQALGALTIGEDGDGKYLAQGSEILFLAGSEMQTPSSADDDDSLPPFRSELAVLSNCFPFGAGGPPDRSLDLLFDYLPEQPRAWSLFETYMEQCAWHFRPIDRSELVDDYLSPIYKSLRERRKWNTEKDFPHTISPHRLAVLFMVFAVAALVDLTLKPHNVESEHYYHASRACLALRSVFDSPEMATVQAILLMSSYHQMGGREYTVESFWSLMCLGSKLAQSLGLHRDSARWPNMDQKIVNRRRYLFWEMFSCELFYSMALGRPASLRLSYIDCEFPTDDEPTLDENGKPQIGYHEFKYTFTRDVTSVIVERTLAAESPTYETILELDKLVRTKTLPAHLNISLGLEDEGCAPGVYMRGSLLLRYRSVALLYIHRTFFAQAMLDHPVNPLRSPYAPSFLAAYRSASGIIKANQSHFHRFPDLCCRWWVIWTHLFSAAIVLGCIVMRAPTSTVAPTAFIELGLACDLFEKGAKEYPRARSGLVIMRKLRQQALEVYSQFRSGNSTAVSDPGFGLASDSGDPNAYDELALSGGQTRILASKILSKNAKQKQKSPLLSASVSREATASPASTTSNTSSSDAIPDVHPSLVDYLSHFPPPTALSPEFPQWDLPLQPSMGQHASSSSTPWSSQAYDPAAHFSDAGTSAQGSSSYVVEDSLQDFSELGMLMTGDAGIDEEWQAFMQKSFSGILDSTVAPTTYPGMGY